MHSSAASITLTLTNLTLADRRSTSLQLQANGAMAPITEQGAASGRRPSPCAISASRSPCCRSRDSSTAMSSNRLSISCRSCRHRYDKLARNFLAAAALVGVLYWIKL
jgi:hypothetical protein